LTAFHEAFQNRVATVFQNRYKPLQKKSKKNFKKLKIFNKNISTSPSGALHLTGDNPFIQAN
jgi:transposase